MILNISTGRWIRWRNSHRDLDFSTRKNVIPRFISISPSSQTLFENLNFRHPALDNVYPCPQCSAVTDGSSLSQLRMSQHLDLLYGPQEWVPNEDYRLYKDSSSMDWIFAQKVLSTPGRKKQCLSSPKSIACPWGPVPWETQPLAPLLCLRWTSGDPIPWKHLWKQSAWPHCTRWVVGQSINFHHRVCESVNSIMAQASWSCEFNNDTGIHKHMNAKSESFTCFSQP